MGERPDEIRRRDPLDPLDATSRNPDPLVDPAMEPVGPITDPAVGGGAVVEEADSTHVEIERTRAEIVRTRADMSETVDAIQGRLSPENLKEQAKDRVKEATVGRAQEAGSGIVETIRANPVPAALTGIGLGWLLMGARRQKAEQTRLRRGPLYPHGYPPAYEAAPYGQPPRYEEQESSGASAGQALGRARDSVGETASQAQEKAGQVASQAQDKVEQVAGQAQDQVSRLGDQARYQARRASGGFQRMLRENPLSVGALAAGVGAAVGLAIPETTKEHEVMGETRDNLVETVQEKAQDAQQKVQRVAEEAQSAAKDEAENQGLTQQ
jgi:ElaB/YqjD/DUF883 family membrane-anchored ribosome-binding protein